MPNLLKCDETQIRVRYGETDQMGIVYHGNYAQYFEIGRIEWLRKFGLSYKEMEAKGVMLPVISLHINFKKSARYDDVITVKTCLVKLPTAKLEFDCEIINEAHEIITTAKVSLVFMDVNRNRPTKCPQYLLDKLQN